MEAHRRILSVTAVALGLVACSVGPNGNNAPKMGADISIGIPLAASGNLIAEGGMARQGYDLWSDWVNNHENGIAVQGVNHRVHLTFMDDASVPANDGTISEQLVSAYGAQFLLGPYGAANTAPVAAVAEKHQVPMVSANGSASSIFNNGYKYTFGVQTPAAQNLQAVFDMASTMNPKPTTIAMLSADDAFSKEVAKGALDYAAMQGMHAVYNQTYPSGSTNLFAQVTAAKAANADILVNSGHLVEAEAVSTASKALRFAAKMVVYSVGPTMPSFVQTLGSDGNYVYTGSQWTAAARYKPDFYMTSPQYVAAYRQKYSTTLEPNYQVADATAAGLALELAIKRANSLDPARVRDALASLDVMTFFGRIKFDPKGQNTFKPMLVEQIQSSQRVTVWPAELSSGAAQYPQPTWAARLGTPDPQPTPPKLPSTGLPPSQG